MASGGPAATASSAVRNSPRARDRRSSKVPRPMSPYGRHLRRPLLALNIRCHWEALVRDVERTGQFRRDAVRPYPVTRALSWRRWD